MNVIRTAIPDVLILEPKVFGDDRGFFYESWNQRAFDEAVGREVRFVQDNHSKSAKGVLRGLHYQVLQVQGKLVRVAAGEVFDAVVDLRRSSPTFGRSVGVTLSAANRRMFWVPEGFAHGFVVTSEHALFHYLVTAPYDRTADANLRWNDAALAINWPVAEPSLSDKDAKAPFLADIPEHRLPVYSP